MLVMGALQTHDFQEPQGFLFFFTSTDPVQKAVYKIAECNYLINDDRLGAEQTCSGSRMIEGTSLGPFQLQG